MANDGREAIDLRMQHHFDLIIMDIQMPVLDGVEATKEILAYEEEKKKQHIPIVALTANALTGDREKYLKAGINDYLSKPIELDTLNHLLQTFFPQNIAGQAQQDVLLFHPLPMLANIFSTVLQNIGHTVEVSNDKTYFLDAIKQGNYRFVIYDSEPFKNLGCKITDLINDRGAQAFIFEHEHTLKENICCETLNEKADFKEIEKKVR